MQNPLPPASELSLPSADVALAQARRQLARTLRNDELVWMVAERFDAANTFWTFDIARRAADGRWFRQRYRFDGQANVLYFMGESSLSDAEFREMRRNGSVIPIAEWHRDDS